jgi:RNA polymerase sigma-70 factor, ECF subfamily
MTSRDPHHLRPLLERALAGDVRAWNDFFGEIRRYLHSEVGRAAGPDVGGPLDHSLIVQSTLRRVWERIGDQFPDGAGADAVGRFLAWIKTILHNRTREEWRKIQRRPTDAAGSAVAVVAEAPARPELAKRDRIAVEVAAALARLPDRKRRVVELFWFEGRSDAEIGQRLGCSAGAVRVLRCRALRELRTPDLLNLLEE